MRNRYFVAREPQERGYEAIVVKDQRRRHCDGVLCYALGVAAAKRIVAALNDHEQRQLPRILRESKAKQVTE